MRPPSAPRQARHVLNQEGTRLNHAHGPDELRKPITGVIVPESLAAVTPRLTWRPARNHINCIAELSEVNVCDIAGVQASGGMLFGVCIERVLIPFRRGDDLHPRVLQPQREATSAGEEIKHRKHGETIARATDIPPAPRAIAGKRLPRHALVPTSGGCRADSQRCP